MSDLETLLPKKGAEQAQEKQTAETESRQSSFAERKQKCLSMIEDAALDAVADAKRYGAFLGVVSRFDRYSPNNQLLIFAQNPQATQLKDFDAWTKEGGTVRKGSHGVMILTPKDYTGKDGQKHRGYDVKSVFDVAAVDGVKLTPEPKPERSQRELMKAVIHACPVTIYVADDYPEHAESGAYFDPQEKCVYAKPGMSNEEMFTSLTQAAAHAGLARTEGESYRPQNAAFAARSIACALANRFDIPGDLVAIESVPSDLREMDSEEVRDKLKQVQGAVKEMTARMLDSLGRGQEKKQPQAEKQGRSAR